MFDTVTPILRTHMRAFVLQGVAIIGLAWCLAEGQAAFAMLLTALVLVDQAIFLRARYATAEPDARGSRLLEGWWVAVSTLDILLCSAAIVRNAGLRDGADGAMTASPLDCLAYVLACFAHGPTTLAPVTAVGRLAGAVLAGLGALMFLGLLIAASLRFRRPD